MKMKSNRLASVMYALAACALLGGCAQTAPSLPADGSPTPRDREQAYNGIEKLTEVMLQIRKNYVEEKDYKEIVDGALQGMLHGLDEHSCYLDPEHLDQMQEETSGEYGGIGIWIGMRDNTITVIAPIEDSPAFRAGLMARDRIVKIDGKNTSPLDLREAVKRLRGAPGTTVTVTIRRETEPKPRDVELEREQIELASVKGTRMIGPGIAYTRITQFSENTSAALDEALAELSEQGMEALVLDLRSNPGGLLKTAIAVAEKFLEKDRLIVSTRERKGSGRDKQYFAGYSEPYTDVYMAVLINHGSASASEIVAGALKDNKRAVLVGETSYGKGSVQTVVRLTTDPDSAMRLTTARYYTPSERQIHGHGIEPDIEVLVDPVLWDDIRIRRRHEEHPEAFTPEELAEYNNVVDPQLTRAVDLLKGMMVFGKKR